MFELEVMFARLISLQVLYASARLQQRKLGLVRSCCLLQRLDGDALALLRRLQTLLGTEALWQREAWR